MSKATTKTIIGSLVRTLGSVFSESIDSYVCTSLSVYRVSNMEMVDFKELISYFDFSSYASYQKVKTQFSKIERKMSNPKKE